MLNFGHFWFALKVAAEAFAAKDVQEVQTIFELAVKDALSELVGYRQKEAA